MPLGHYLPQCNHPHLKATSRLPSIASERQVLATDFAGQALLCNIERCHDPHTMHPRVARHPIPVGTQVTLGRLSFTTVYRQWIAVYTRRSAWHARTRTLRMVPRYTLLEVAKCRIRLPKWVTTQYPTNLWSHKNYTILTT